MNYQKTSIFFIVILTLVIFNELQAQTITSKGGLAQVIDNEEVKGKYVAYHNEAPMGTVIQVKLKDSETPKVVFVRVIGKIPEKTKKKIIILLSPKASQTLSEENKYKVELEYPH